MEIIRIINMDEYNPRKDRKRHVWFRVENTIAWGPKLFGLNPEQKWFWICLLALASHTQSDWVELDYAYLESTSKVSLENIKDALVHLENKGAIEIEDVGNQVVTNRLPSGSDENTGGITTDRQTDRRTDGQTDAVNGPHEYRTALMVTALSSQNDEVFEALKNVKPETQGAWVKRWGSHKAIAASLAQCLLKRKEKGLKFQPAKIESVFTNWLEKEKNLVEVKHTQEWQNPDAGPHTGGPENYQGLLQKFGVKSLVDTLPGAAGEKAP